MAPNFLLGFSNQELISDLKHRQFATLLLYQNAVCSNRFEFCFSVFSHTCPSFLGLFKYHPVFWLRI